MLKKTQGLVDVDASRILVKGPEFLRRQMERESEANKGRVSAVERLAATKPQYVKSQQVVGSTPVISIGSASVSSRGSSNGHGSVNNAARADVEAIQSPEEDSNVVRRSSSKKRDSILLYRQKCELLRGSPGGSRRLIKKSLFAIKDKTNAFSEARGGECATRRDCGKEAPRVNLPISNGHSGETNDLPRGPPHRIVAETQEQERKSRRGVARSSSDISSRYSKNFADFDAFFKYCGLEGDVIESLGREKFSARSDNLSSKILSISVSTSDDGFSRSSDGLHEEELQETVRQGSSVVERNARIIKWLYSCRNAAESGKTLRDLD
ncbi:protein FAM110C-like [Sinocyclocheilus rhinocerous]|uniref:Protein FAM110C-like n=1 Tax=Sinocyclocheilus rhinocerous TaxID=307959 RepID=A0A673M5T4_9TELE|nr:PREDICTED: protein FAM110C-like [Sinocyclocheilus rhinocerous]